MLTTLRAGDNCPTVTVGICVKNSERTIGECLNSIVNLDYDKSKLEIVVIDGNSTDNTLTLAKKILEKSDARYKILNDKGKGLGYARQLVVENANSKHICWVDGDNVLTRDFIENHVKFIEKNPSVGIAVPLTLFNSKRFVARLQGYSWFIGTLNAMKKGKTPFLAMQGTITPLKALRKVGGFNVLIRGAGEDIDVIGKMRLQGFRVAVNPKALVYHRMRESWKDLFKQASWWGGSQPRKQIKVLLSETLLNFLVCTKLTLDVIRYFKDPAGLLMPLYALAWSAYYLTSSLCSESEMRASTWL